MTRPAARIEGHWSGLVAAAVGVLLGVALLSTGCKHAPQPKPAPVAVCHNTVNADGTVAVECVLP